LAVSFLLAVGLISRASCQYYDYAYDRRPLQDRIQNRPGFEIPEVDLGSIEAALHSINSTVLPNVTGSTDSCIIAGRSYSSRLFKVQPANSIETCIRFCCGDNACNFWSFGSGGKNGQKFCYLFSQVLSTIPRPRKGFSSGLKGCALPPKCLLFNTKITAKPITTVPKVNDYVACSQLCKTPVCAFWSFGDQSPVGTGPGTCYIYATGVRPDFDSEKNYRFISGPVGCPPKPRSCKS